MFILIFLFLEVNATPNLLVDIKKQSLETFDDESLTILNAENGGVLNINFKSGDDKFDFPKSILKKIYFVKNMDTSITKLININHNSNFIEKKYINIYFEYFSENGDIPSDNNDLIFGIYKLEAEICNGKIKHIQILDDKTQDLLFKM